MSFFSRNRRILGRLINGKTLPKFTYRWDKREPGVVAISGFQPWNTEGVVTIFEHVRNSYSSGPQIGKAVKHDSQWVSTGGVGMLKKLDPVFAQQVLDNYLYKIDTSVACRTGNFFDVNDTFDRAAMHRPYATQREWIKERGIPAVRS